MSSPWRRVTSLSREERVAVLNLCDRVELALGREAIDEGRRRTVVHGGVAQHWLHGDGALDGYALVTGVARPSVAQCGGGFDPALLARLLETYPEIDWWIRGAHDVAGCVTVRTLQFMRAALPVATTPPPPDATLRTFEPGVDDRAWIEQNNAAFADHPEQGAWSHADLAARLNEAWFDPSGFLLLEWRGRLVASCWTKVHELYAERYGEIYVVSVHPDFQHLHLGRVMVTQGLAALRRKGVATAVLFVDRSNEPARRLYGSLGFRVEREDRLVRFTRSGAHKVADGEGHASG